MNEKMSHVRSKEDCNKKMTELEKKIDKPFYVLLGICLACGGAGTLLGYILSLARLKGML